MKSTLFYGNMNDSKEINKNQLIKLKTSPELEKNMDTNLY